MPRRIGRLTPLLLLRPGLEVWRLLRNAGCDDLLAGQSSSKLKPEESLLTKVTFLPVAAAS